MDIKKLSILLAMLIVSSTTASYAVKTIPISESLQNGIAKYKTGDYLGAKQDIDEALSKNPNNDMANYYLGNVLFKIGKKEDAKKAYENVANNPEANQALVKYSKFAIGCMETQGNSQGGGASQPSQPQQPQQPTGQGAQAPLTPADPCDLDALTSNPDVSKFIRSGKFLHSDAKKAIQESQLQNIQNTINSGAKSIEFSKYRYLNNADDATPTDAEIASAVKTLAKVGINPFVGAAASIPEYAYLGQNNNSDPMLSLMMSQNGGKMNPELIQAMMMNQLMPAYDFSDTGRNRGF